MKIRKISHNEKKINYFEVILVVSFILFSFAVVSSAAFAEPEGVLEMNKLFSTRRSPALPENSQAVAGNVTALNIFGKTVTQTWQGYAGNISGNITLEDSSGNVLYNWAVSNPSGEIYASTDEINFADGNIGCYNFTRSGSGYLDIAFYENSLGLMSNDVDGIDETFTPGLSYDSFYAGTNYIDDICPETQLYNSTGNKNSAFQEVILYDYDSNNTVFTSIINDAATSGFNNQHWNFQMIVPENGHDGNTESTTYYFYVELE
jgi:hypothetical protein